MMNIALIKRLSAGSACAWRSSRNWIKTTRNSRNVGVDVKWEVHTVVQPVHSLTPFLLALFFFFRHFRPTLPFFLLFPCERPNLSCKN